MDWRRQDGLWAVRERYFRYVCVSKCKAKRLKFVPPCCTESAFFKDLCYLLRVPFEQSELNGNIRGAILRGVQEYVSMLSPLQGADSLLRETKEHDRWDSAEISWSNRRLLENWFGRYLPVAIALRKIASEYTSPYFTSFHYLFRKDTSPESGKAWARSSFSSRLSLLTFIGGAV